MVAENREFFSREGIELGALESSASAAAAAGGAAKRNGVASASASASARSDVALLVKVASRVSRHDEHNMTRGLSTRERW